MSSCCGNTFIGNMERAEIMNRAHLDQFNDDVKNIIYCLQAIEHLTGPKAAEDLRARIIKCIENNEVPNW